MHGFFYGIMFQLPCTMNRILLHACCGPCLTHCVDFLRTQNYKPTLFFSNSNIMPREEYDRRLVTARDYAVKQQVEFIGDDYDHDAWLKSVKGLEAEPEGGRRCSVCFRFNLRRAADYACKHNFPELTSTLTVSPHKRSMLVFEAGDAAVEAVAAIYPKRACSLRFIRFDFKKKNGFLTSVRLAEKHGLYRQSYCGCEFSEQV